MAKKTPKKVAKKTAVKKTAAKSERKHPDMLTVSMRGDNAKPILAFMSKYKIKGAVLFRAAFELYADEVKAGNIDPNAGDEDEA